MPKYEFSEEEIEGLAGMCCLEYADPDGCERGDCSYHARKWFKKHEVKEDKDDA